MEEGINNSGSNLLIATSLHIGSISDLVWPLGWALANKKPQICIFSEADTFSAPSQ